MIEKIFKRSENKSNLQAFVPFNFSLHGRSLKLIRESLEKPRIGGSSLSTKAIMGFSQEILTKLPLVINDEFDIPVSLSQVEVDMITRLLQVQRKRLSVHGDGRLSTMYSQEIWNVNIAFISAGGEICSSFKNFLFSFHLQPGMKTLDFNKPTKKRKINI